MPFPLYPYELQLLLPFQEENEPSIAPESHRISPSFSASPRSLALISCSVPSLCQDLSRRCPELFDAHCGPRGRSHHRLPVIKIYSNEFKIIHEETTGGPCPLFSFLVKMSSNSFHSASLSPSTLPAISMHSIEGLFNIRSVFSG
jgi:hypothetical protein